MDLGARLLIAACIAVVAAAPAAMAAERPSFDCNKAGTVTEKAICSIDHLARLDRAIASAFRQLKADMAAASDEIVEEQAEFLKQRDACGADAACLANKMEARRRDLALERGSADPREAFIGRYSNKIGWMIVRRTFEGKIEILGQTGDPRGRWMCDISGELSVDGKKIVSVEAGEDGDSHPVRLSMRGSSLRLTEDEDRPLAGYTCGANGSVNGDYRRVNRLR